MLYCPRKFFVKKQFTLSVLTSSKFKTPPPPRMQYFSAWSNIAIKSKTRTHWLLDLEARNSIARTLSWKTAMPFCDVQCCEILINDIPKARKTLLIWHTVLLYLNYVISSESSWNSMTCILLNDYVSPFFDHSLEKLETKIHEGHVFISIPYTSH